MRKIEAASALIARIVWYGGYTLLAYLIGAFVMGTGDVWEWEQGERGMVAFAWALFGGLAAAMGEMEAIDNIQRGLIDLFEEEEQPQ
jgi:hypothetical protein